jgi:hypothetical protein
MGNRISFWIVLTIVPLHFLAVPAHAQDARKPVRLSVDLRDATKHIFHAKVTLPNIHPSAPSLSPQV